MRERRLAAWLGAALCWSLVSPSTTAAPTEDWPAVIAQLQEAVDRQPQHAAIRTELAVAHNNYGVQLAGQGLASQAIQELQEAHRLAPDNVQFQTNLATVYVQSAHDAYQAQQTQRARDHVKQALALDPKATQAYVLLGELEYQSQHLPEARAAWQRALELEPGLEDITARLERLAQELPVEADFDKISQASFDIRYAEGIPRSAGLDIRDMLLRARRTIGSHYAYWPAKKLVVLVYSAEQFRQLRQDTPDWVAGQYDGKIRVPLPGRQFDEDAVRRTLYHEYTHALLHELTHGRLPTWFNEGLAELEAWEGRAPAWTALRDALAEHRVLPWAELSEHFSMSRTAQDVSLAYEQAHSMLAYLEGRYGMWRIRRVLNAVDDGQALEEALTAELRVKLPRLEAEWRKRLPEQLGLEP